MPSKSSLFAFSFKLLDELLFTPSDLRGKISQSTELSEAGKLNTSHSIRNVLLFSCIIGGWNSFKNFEFAESNSSSGGFVGKHTSDTSPENS